MPRCVQPMRLLILFAFAIFVGNAAAAEPVLVRVNTFPNARALAFIVGIEKGVFEKYGIKVEVEFTDNSENQRAALAAGKIDIVHSAVDNAVALVEVANVDVVIV